LKVAVTPELIDAVAAGLPLTVIGQASLPAPLAGLAVLARSSAPRSERPGSLALAAIIQPRGLLKDPVLKAPGLTGRRKRGAVLLGKDYVAGPGIWNQLVVHCGAWPVVVPLISPSAPARPLQEAADAKTELERFAELLATIVTGLYEKGHAPDLEIRLAKTGLTVDTALSALRKLRDVAARAAASASGPGTDAPGRAYEPPATDEEATSFDDVAGQDDAKDQVRAIVQAIKDPDSYRRWGARPPRGLLLFGPPGTGKTMLARSLAREAGASFISVRATDVTSKWYGEAERRLQEAFDWARREAPAVLFFDEIDALGRARDDSHEATHRLVSTFLQNMDGLEPLKGVFVVGATNRPEAIDDALTRAGRFDRLVEVPLPSPAGRRQIFEVHMRRAERGAGRRLFEPIDAGGWERLITATAGYSGADIAEAIRRALEVKVRTGAEPDALINQEELLVQAMSVARPW
jgi:AAA+ superfamily predicted ATPase